MPWGASHRHKRGMQAFSSNPSAVIRFTGEDQAEFLQGQGTADLMRPTGSSTYSLWLDFKGNILGDGFVLRLGPEESLLISYASEATALMEKFDRHIIADDVELEDLTQQYCLFSIPADAVENAANEAGLEIPEEGAFGSLPGGYLFKGRRLGLGTLELLMEKEEAKALQVEQIPLIEAERMRVEAGILLVPLDTGAGSANPVETGLVSAVSFEKGCYLGQEVVARAHRLGRSTRRFATFSGQSTELPGGIELSIEGRPVGEITSVVKNRDNLIALGWIKSKISDGENRFDQGILHVKSL